MVAPKPKWNRSRNYIFFAIVVITAGFAFLVLTNVLRNDRVHSDLAKLKKAHNPPLFNTVGEEIDLLSRDVKLVKQRLTDLELRAHSKPRKSSQATAELPPPQPVGGGSLVLKGQHFESGDKGVATDVVGSPGDTFSATVWLRTSSRGKQTVLCMSPGAWTYGAWAVILDRSRIAFDIFDVGTACSLVLASTRPRITWVKNVPVPSRQARTCRSLV